MNRPARTAGSALITAVFLVIVLASLGAAMVSLSNVQQDTVAKSVISSRVYYGAKTGLEWSVQRVITDSTRCLGGTFPATFSPTGAGMSGVSVTVTCARTQHGTGTTSFTYYITSIATTGTLGTLSYAERRMEATVSNIP
jgi:MSHA biogenesis protein MshP